MVIYKTPPRRAARRVTPTARVSMQRRGYAKGIIPRALNFTPARTGYRYGKAFGRTVGFPVGTRTGLRRNTINKWTTVVSDITSKTLYGEDVTAVPRKVGTEINARERDMINCLGFSLRFYISNKSQSVARNVRMALISPTDKNEINNTEFFRGYEDSRALDFATTLDSHELMCNSINRDNYVVLWEKKLTVGPTADTAGGWSFDRTKPSYTSFNTFVPLNRQLRYDGDSANECSDKIFLVMWYDTVGGVGTDATGIGLTYKRYVITHWKDPST